MPTGANSVSNVTAGKPKVGGAVYRAPKGTELPADATTTLDTAFKCMGYISDEGITNGNRREVEDVKAWGGKVVLNPQTGHKDNIKLVFVESMNLEVLKTYFGNDNVTGTSLESGIKINVNDQELDESVFVVDMIAAGNIPHRIVIPRGKPTETEDITYVDNDAVGLGMTITAYPDDSEKENNHYEYFGGTETLAAKASAPAGDTEADTAAPAEQPTALAAAEPAAAQAAADAPAEKTSRKASKKATKTAAPAADA